MADFKNLIVWRKAHALSLDVTALASSIRGSEHAALRNQMVRAAASIPANIVEGRAMKGPRDFARFIGYAVGSASELEYHLIAAHDRGLISDEAFDTIVARVIEVRKMLYGLLRTLRAAPTR